jgi:hypothetical protein
MPLPLQIALVSEIPDFPLDELMKVSAALQKQATRDLAPIWNVQATVDAFASLDDVEIGYWPMILVRDVPNAAGVHLDKDGQPYALIEQGPSWSLTASHECLEMLVDPFGDRLIAGQSAHPEQGRVEFLVEVCDPSEADDFAYTVNGVLVSDFYTPAFFDPVTAPSVRYSFGGHIQAPRSILQGGYLSWHEPVTDHWWQQTWFGGPRPAYRDFGVFSADDPRSIREIVDSKSPELARLSNVPMTRPSYKRSLQSSQSITSSTAARAARIRDQIRALCEHPIEPVPTTAATRDAPAKRSPRVRKR